MVVIHTFIIMLAAFQQQRQLLVGAWVQILNSWRDTPVNNWTLFNRILHHRASRSPGFGLTFVPLTDVNQPWNVRTSWTMDRFMSFLMLICPSSRSFCWLIDYADAYVRTRPVGGVISNISVPNLPTNRFYLVPFIPAPSFPTAFLPASATATSATPAAESSAQMDVNTPTSATDPLPSTEPPEPLA